MNFWGRKARATYERVTTIIGRAKRVISHGRLKDGHHFQPRFYPQGLACQKKVRRALMGLPPSTQGKAPRPGEVRRREAMAARLVRKGRSAGPALRMPRGLRALFR